MKALKPLVSNRRFGKTDREKRVLLGLVDYYLKTGKPVGSNTLKDAGFGELSSATIRNYFAHLEKEGYLDQQHSSGGRLPTNKAYRLYAQEHYDSHALPSEDEKTLGRIAQEETKAVASFLQEAADILSRMTKTAVFLSAPRFDQDYITDIRLVSIDHARCLCIIVTDFGMIQTEVLNVDKKLSSFSIKRLEAYFHWRLSGQGNIENLTKEEEALAQDIYNEILLRYIVGYSHFSDEDIYRTGFSKLLTYPDFQDLGILGNSLGLFENTHGMQLILKECCKLEQMKYWIGEDLIPYSEETPNCAIIASPYRVNQHCVGAVGLLGPARIHYRHLFALMRRFSEAISEALTRNIYKFKINFRKPQPEVIQIKYSRQLPHHIQDKN